MNLYLYLHFIDVGQGDAILVIADNVTHRNNLLVDAGPSKAASQLVDYLRGTSIRSLNVLATHPDADHVGGMPKVINAFNVSIFVYNGDAKYNNLKFMQTLRSKGVMFLNYSAGNGVVLVSGINVTVLNPPEKRFGNSNEDSLALKVSVGSFCAILTGDAEAKAEGYMLGYGSDVRCPLLKVAHHGSRYTSSAGFLKTVGPEIAIISVGANSYGHPSADIISRLTSAGAKVYRTDQDGTIIAYSDGKTYSITKKRKPAYVPSNKYNTDMWSAVMSLLRGYSLWKA